VRGKMPTNREKYQVSIVKKGTVRLFILAVFDYFWLLLLTVANKYAVKFKDICIRVKWVKMTGRVKMADRVKMVVAQIRHFLQYFWCFLLKENMN
jgi:hypothetical protein